jgi:hypothetical protein
VGLSDTACSHWLRARIHATAGIGAREYSRSSPSSLSSHVTGPEVTTGSERAIGVFRSIPRWGRAFVVVEPLSQDALKVPTVEDQDPVQALAPGRTNVPLDVGIGNGRRNRRPDHLDAFCLKDKI